MNTDELLAAEISKLHTLLALQNSPLKEGPLAKIPTSSSSNKGLSIEISRLEYDGEARTLNATIYPEVGGLSSSSSSSSRSSSSNDISRARQLLLAPPIRLELFFPESPSDPLYALVVLVNTAALLAERINTFILPIERSSLMHAVSKIVSTIKQDVDTIWPSSLDYRGNFLHSLADHLATSITSADFLLSLLSMSKSYHPSVRFPVPKYFYRDNSQVVDQSALHSAIASIPPLDLLKDPTSPASQGLSFASCVLLHHLLFRERVSLVEGQVQEDPELRHLLDQAGITSLPDDAKPSTIFKVIHAEDARFAALSEKHGTTVGFHGSPPENMFSIVSLGLRNLSGTKGMRNGAAFGEGVYLASQLGVARNFGCWGVKVWRHSRLGAGGSLDGSRTSSCLSTSLSSSLSSSSQQSPLFAYQIIALCEFINLPKYRVGSKSKAGGGTTKASSMTNTTITAAASSATTSITATAGSLSSGKDSSEYYVIDEDQHLVVRALLLFRDPAVRGPPFPPSSLSTAGAAVASFTTTTATVSSSSSSTSIPTPQRHAREATRSPAIHHTYQPSVALMIVVALVALAIALSGFQKQQLIY